MSRMRDEPGRRRPETYARVADMQCSYAKEGRATELPADVRAALERLTFRPPLDREIVCNTAD